MIDLDKASLAEIKSILRKHMDHAEIRVFGSRITGQAKKFSDLDLVIIAEKPIPMRTLNALKFDFSNSNLPILVDVVDWHGITKEFRKIIMNNSKILVTVGSIH